jgi:hypothetical protein
VLEEIPYVPSLHSLSSKHLALLHCRQRLIVTYKRRNPSYSCEVIGAMKFTLRVCIEVTRKEVSSKIESQMASVDDGSEISHYFKGAIES